MLTVKAGALLGLDREMLDGAAHIWAKVGHRPSYGIRHCLGSC